MASRSFAYSPCFFFQAEDGIRDLVRSRGLGDVYKRQEGTYAELLLIRRLRNDHEIVNAQVEAARAGSFGHHTNDLVLLQPEAHRLAPVSYTHLTLPTSDLV